MNQVHLALVWSLGFFGLLCETGFPQDSTVKTNDALAIRFLLNDERVTGELELVPEQVERLNTVLNSMQRDMSEYAKSVNPFKDDPETRVARQEEFLLKSARLAEELQAELLPHQLKRLKQILFSFKAVRSDSKASHLILTKAVNEALQLTEDQHSKIEELVASQKKELDEEIAVMQKKIVQLKEKQHREVLHKLSEEQCKQLDELCGFPFDFLRPTTIGR